MKKSIVLSTAFTVLFLTFVHGKPFDVCQGDVVLSSKHEVIYFSGSEVIRTLASSGEDVTNLRALSPLTKVGGLLDRDNTNLQSISGLWQEQLDPLSENPLVITNNNLQLTSLGRLNLGSSIVPIEVTSNPSIFSQVTCEGDVVLTSQAEVDAFNCNEIVGKLTISGDDITNVDALSSLRSVFGGLIIENNPNLQNLNGFSSLTDVEGFEAIRIANNPSLNEISGFSALINTTRGGIVIEHNNSLTNIGGFNALKKIGSNVYSLAIFDNPSLIGIEGFTSADTIGGILIKDNNVLANINGFSNLTTIRGQLEIVNNNSLRSLAGFDKVTQAITGFLEPAVIIENNVSLENLDGLSSLEVIAGRRAELRIANNPALANIDGLSALTTIRGGSNGAGFRVENNDALKNIDGLRSLTTVDWGMGGGFFILGNELLNNIDALSSLRYSTGIVEFLTIRVKDNPSLTKCCGLFPWFRSMGASRIADIKELDFSNNGGGCTLEDILGCEGQLISDFSLFDRGFDDNTYSSVNDTLTIDVANSRFTYWVLRANTLPTHVGSVEFKFDHSISHVENVFPYHFAFPVLELGTHKVVTNVYSGPNKTGKRGMGKTLTLIVVNTAAITNFDVVNTSGEYLMQLTEDSRINIKDPTFKSVSIRANTFPDPVTSVKFWLNGQFFRVENVPPYAFNGDINGVYNPWVVNPSDYRIKAIPYIKVGGKEYAGKPLEVHFKVVSENLNYAVVGYDIVDTSGKFIQHLNEGDVVSIDQPMTVIANTTGQVGSVKFILNNQFYRTENVPPYTITGDQNGYFNPWVPQSGNYTLTGTPFSNTSAGGEAGKSFTIHFVVGNDKANAAARSVTAYLERDTQINSRTAGLSVYPVPVEHELHLSLNEEFGQSVWITIMNAQGVDVYKGSYSNSKSIDMIHFSSGVYFLHVVNQQGTQKVMKFIKK